VGLDEKVFKSLPVSQLSLHKFHARRKQVAPAMAQIVENHRLVAHFSEQPRDSSTNVTSSSSN
jgi:hypothetical protein